MKGANSRSTAGWLRLAGLGAVLLLSGCAHNIAFQDAHYAVGGERTERGVVAVIDNTTLQHEIAIRSFMTGIAHSWEAQPGLMLSQVADIEFPQMFASYQSVRTIADADLNDDPLVIELYVPAYRFSDFHATITVRAVARTADRDPLFDQTYTAQGIRQGGKMFWGGAFAMKSAVRQSSFDAFQKIFARLRADLNRALPRIGTKEHRAGREPLG